MPADSVSFLTTEEGGRLAYVRRAGSAPGVVFLTGLRSDMEGGKALALEKLCAANGSAFLRFDYSGHGQSSGEFIDGTIGRWANDAIQILDSVTEGPQILVGSSMGGWIMLLTAVSRPDRVAGLVGIAAAPDFTADFERALSPDQLQTLESDGRIDIPSEYAAEPTPFTQTLLIEARRHLLLDAEIPVQCPIRLLHGMRESDVPWQTSLEIAEQVTGNDVVLQLAKDGDHRLSRDTDIGRLQDVVASLLDQVRLSLPDV